MAEEVQNQTHEFPPKQIRLKEIKDDEDRISRLPDSLLVEILSRLLDTKCAVRTGALSKRWKHIWLSVPIFILAHHGNPSADFFSFVDKTLTQRGQLKLKKFSVYSDYNDQFELQIHNWIRYAINCNVEELDIMFWHINRPDLFPLDQCFYINSYFTDLTLSECHFNPAGAISWKSLLSLHISGVDLDEDLVKNILSGSPVLETLRLEECYGYRRLNITSKSVKKLVIDGYMQGGDVIEINAPTILSLEIQAQLYMKNLLLVNVSSLVEADLGYKLCGSNIEIISKKDEEKMLKRFILNLKHVKEVKISSYCVKVMSHLENKGFIFPSNLKVCDDENFIDPYESDDDLELSDQFNSDSDESIDSDLLLLDDGPSDDEVQQQ